MGPSNGFGCLELCKEGTEHSDKANLSDDGDVNSYLHVTTRSTTRDQLLISPMALPDDEGRSTKAILIKMFPDIQRRWSSPCRVVSLCCAHIVSPNRRNFRKSSAIVCNINGSLALFMLSLHLHLLLCRQWPKFQSTRTFVYTLGIVPWTIPA